MGTKSRNAKKSMNRGRGRGRGTSGRGRGRGGRGGGRGGHSGVPTSYGYATQQPTSFKHLDDLYDDFKVYGQFASESDDDHAANRSARHSAAKHSQKSKRPNFPSRGGMRTFNDDEDSFRHAAAGLGYRGIATSTAASISQAKMPVGRSKYTKMMVFHKSATLLNNDSQVDSEQEVESSTTYKPSSAPTSEGKTTALDFSESSDEVEIIDANEITHTTQKQELDELLSGLTLQDPSLVSVVDKLTRKERREQRFQELLGISDTDSDADDEDEDEELFDNTGDFSDDIYLDADDVLVDEDELANMLDYIEHSGLKGDAQEELIAYYAALVDKLATLGIEPTGGKASKGAKKKVSKKSEGQKEVFNTITVKETVEVDLTSDTDELLDLLEDSDNYDDDTEENEDFLVDEEGLAALKSYLAQDDLDSTERDELQAAYDVLCERLAKKTSLSNLKVTDQLKQDRFGNTIVATPSSGKRVKASTPENLSEVYLDPYSDEEIHIISTTESKLKNNLSIDESDDEDEDEFFEEEDEVEDYQDSEEGAEEVELEEDAIDELEIEAEEDEEDDESDEEYADDTYYELEADDDNIIIDAVPPTLQKGYHAVSKYSAREARQRRMLKTEAFELDVSLQLTDKQRRKLEKKAEKQRQKEKPLSSKKQKKLMKESDENVDLRKIDQKLQQFIRDDSITTYQMAPLAKYTRRQVHLLATAYNLKSKSLGSGSTRYPVLSKTDRTFIPQDRRYIERFISEAQSTLDEQGSILRKHRVSNNMSPGYPTKSKQKRGAGKKSSSSQNQSPTMGSATPHGYVVASDALPISEQNIGHQMLAAMGWRQGDSLGTEGTGITNPIQAIVRKKLHLQSSGVAVNDACVDTFQELKLRHKYKYIIFKLSDDLKEIEVESSAEKAEYGDFLENLPKDEPRYAIYDFEYEKPGEGLRSKIIFYAWTPDTSKIRSKMLYASSKDALRRKLVGIAIEVQGTDYDEVDEEAILEKAQRSA